MYRKLEFIVVMLLILFAYSPAHATVYLNLNAEEGTVGTVVPLSLFHQDDPPQPPYGGARATYQSSGGTPQGSKYYQWQTVDNQLDHYTEILLNNGNTLTNIIGNTYYLAYYFRFDKINGLDIWHEILSGQSADKVTDIMGSGVRWIFGAGQWPCVPQNQDHHFTVWLGFVGNDLNPGIGCLGMYVQNSNGYSGANSMQLTYETWHSVVIAIKMAADNTGSLALYINGIKTTEYNNIKTAANSSPTLSHLYMGGTIAQPAYDAPAHYRKFDAFLFTDNWQDIVDGGYLSGDGGDTPPPSDGGGGGNNSGGDSSASGGSGCGFVKDINGKGLKAKGELLSIAILLLALIHLKLRKIIFYKTSLDTNNVGCKT